MTPNAYIEDGAAQRYDSARMLPEETTRLWLNMLLSSIPITGVQNILDLGSGTGRFTATLASAFRSQAIGVEPSRAMLDIAISGNEPNVEWKQGDAENIPLPDRSVDMVFMSQVFHHIGDRGRALAEINRVLRSEGYLVIRNGTLEHNGRLHWLRFFPAALEIEQRRTPSSEEIINAVGNDTFQLVTHRVVEQLFAASHEDYFNKVSQRGLSALIAISDEDFIKGEREFKKWVDTQPANVPIHEPVDLFVFQKRVVLNQ